jgi:hypothetical protein
MSGSLKVREATNVLQTGFKSFTRHRALPASCILITRAKKSAINSRDGGLRVDTPALAALYQNGG